MENTNASCNFTAGDYFISAERATSLEGARDAYGPDFTDMIIHATGPMASPRLRVVIADLIRHLHDFCRDNRVTIEEWLAAVDFVSNTTHSVYLIYLIRRTVVECFTC